MLKCIRKFIDQIKKKFECTWPIKGTANADFVSNRSLDDDRINHTVYISS